MLTDLFDNFSFLVLVCDSFFFSVRNEPRICLKKSVILVCQGRATYLIGFQFLDILFVRPGIHGPLKSNCSEIFKIVLGLVRSQIFKPVRGSLYPAKPRRQFESQPQNLCFEGILDVEFVSPVFVFPDFWCSLHRNSWMHQLLQASRIFRPKLTNWPKSGCMAPSSY